MPQKPPSTVPTISAEQAREVALASVGKSRPGLTLEASAPELRVYVPELLGLRAGPAQLAWMTEVTSPDTLSLRELVLVDAHTGKIALRFNQIATGLNRQIYSTTGTLLPGALVRSEGGPATGDPDADRSMTTWAIPTASSGTSTDATAWMGWDFPGGHCSL